MLSLPRFTRSLLDSLDDDFMVCPMDYVFPQSQRFRSLGGQLAVPRITGDKFNLDLDMRQFDPNEISVKFDQNSLQIHGKREKKADDGHQYEYREYVQHFTVPDNVVHEQLKCQMDNKGYLKIEAPVKVEQIDMDKPRQIPIEFAKK
ncbi:hypothetical protein RDWZM_009705 [Blomia tropicalis]|uniref:SHSP domain-containing protein n=1 Tax=Blomia tropicalis TaxID=40697 RepID=A0A9Q0M4I3_BLOTA|nr:hypothetical protein RDWZM_009705 [Blomia tropicalis]